VTTALRGGGVLGALIPTGERFFEQLHDLSVYRTCLGLCRSLDAFKHLRRDSDGHGRGLRHRVDHSAKSTKRIRPVQAIRLQTMSEWYILSGMKYIDPLTGRELAADDPRTLTKEQRIAATFEAPADVTHDAGLAAIWADIAKGRMIEARYTRDQIAAAALRDSAVNAERTSNALWQAAMNGLFWRVQNPTEAEKVALGLDDVLWPEQLKQAHAEGREP
jgi:hypothetical protein